MPETTYKIGRPISGEGGATGSSVRFKINTPPVIHQTLEGEVIVVNLDTGTYYSLDGVAAAIWGELERGASVEETVERAVGRYGAPGPLVEPAVTRFVEELVREELIVTANGAGGPGPAPATPAAAGGSPPTHFAEPVLHKYTDMQELLLLDPIHEVDEQGWPHSLDGAPPGEA